MQYITTFSNLLIIYPDNTYEKFDFYHYDSKICFENETKAIAKKHT